jgi:Serine/threonine protein kinase
MEKRVAGRYRVGRKIGKGSFGEIFVGVNVQNNENVAIKFEKAGSRHPQLQYESRLYRILQGSQGIPNIH